MSPPKAVQSVFCFAELGAPPACGGHASGGFGLERHAGVTLESETMGGGAR
jgi:hypothetical protein